MTSVHIIIITKNVISLIYFCASIIVIILTYIVKVIWPEQRYKSEKCEKTRDIAAVKHVCEGVFL